MKNFLVIEKATGGEVYRYQSDEGPIEWNGWEFATHDHIEYTEPVQAAPAVDPVDWRITVGSFFDRFGILKLFILASDDAVIRGMIFDCLSRKFIDIGARREEINAMLDILISKGYQINKAAVLDTPPTPAERAE